MSHSLQYLHDRFLIPVSFTVKWRVFAFQKAGYESVKLTQYPELIPDNTCDDI